MGEPKHATEQGTGQGQEHGLPIKSQDCQNMATTDLQDKSCSLVQDKAAASCSVGLEVPGLRLPIEMSYC